MYDTAAQEDFCVDWGPGAGAGKWLQRAPRGETLRAASDRRQVRQQSKNTPTSKK